MLRANDGVLARLERLKAAGRVEIEALRREEGGNGARDEDTQCACMPSLALALTWKKTILLRGLELSGLIVEAPATGL